MEAKELRIGNLVNWVGSRAVHEITVSCFASEWTSERGSFFNQLKPLPLTEMWLLKFGFKGNSGLYYLNEHEVYISVGIVEKDVTFYIDDYHQREKCRFSHINYVHQLQNLYFALTGEELQIKVEA